MTENDITIDNKVTKLIEMISDDIILTYESNNVSDSAIKIKALTSLIKARALMQQCIYFSSSNE